MNRLGRMPISWWGAIGIIGITSGIGTVTYLLDTVGLIAIGLILALCFIVLWALEPQRTGVLWVIFAASLALLPFGEIRVAVGTLMVPLAAFFSVLPIGIMCLQFLVTRNMRLEDRGILISVALLLFGNTLSLMVAQAPELGAPLLAKWVFHSLLFVFLMSFRDRVWHVRTLLTLVLVTGGLSAYGLLEYVLSNTESEVNFYAGVGTRSVTGHHLALLLPLAMGLGMARELSPSARLSVWTSIGLSLIALPFTFNRSSWLAVLLGYFVFGTSRRRVFVLSLIGLYILVLGYVGPQEIVDRFWSIFAVEEDIRRTSITNAGRLESQWRGLKMILDHPVFGVGIGNFALNVPRNIADAFKNPHDFYLTTWAEGGIVAFIGLLGVFYFVTKRVLQGLRETTRSMEENLLRGALGSLVSLFTLAFFTDDLNFVLVWTILGLSVSGSHLWVAECHEDTGLAGSRDSKSPARLRMHSEVCEALPVGGDGGTP